MAVLAREDRSKHFWLGLILLLAAPLAPAVVNALVNPNRPAWSEMALGEGEVDFRIIDSWTAPVLWIDARHRKDYDAAHIPDAILLNEDEWSELFPACVEKWQPGMKVVVYCSSRQCDASKSVAARLRKEAAMEDVYVLKGGWETWLKK